MDRRFGVPKGPATSSEEVRIRPFDVESYPDGRRLKCTQIFTPFEHSPDVEIVIEDLEGRTALVAISSVWLTIRECLLFTSVNPLQGRDQWLGYP